MRDNVTQEANRFLAEIMNLLVFHIAGEMTLTQGAPLLGRLRLEPAAIAKILHSARRERPNR